LLCAFDFDHLSRVVVNDREFLLVFETSRALITARFKCIGDKAKTLSAQVLDGTLLDLRDTQALGIENVKLSDYLEWETMLPPQRAQRP
jgi:hypothetical protein